jgi:trimethylamine--corrinoid protein Co-methyltransferase
MQIRFSALNPNEQQAIHLTALSILERVGIRVHNDTLYRILKRAGARAGQSDPWLRLPQQMVAEALDAAPQEWDLMDQTGNHLPLPAPEPRFVARLLLPGVLDYDQPQPRLPRTQDIVNLCRLANALPQASIVYKTDCACSDVPEEFTYLETIAIVYKNTTKHCLANPINPDSTRYWVELGEAATGKPIGEQPVVLCGIPATSPLQIDKDSGESLIYLTKKRAPVNCMTMPIAGLSAPMTLAGTLAQHTAEALALITAVQVINPGTPVCFAGAPCTANMKTGNIVMASPAHPLFNNALTTMARYYGLPSYASATYTDAVTPSIQCGAEKALAALSGMAAGSDIGMLGGDLCAAKVVSLEQLLIDYDVWEAACRVLRGVVVGPATLAQEVIERAGASGQFLTDSHTLAWLRRDEQSLGQLFNRDGSYEKAQTMLEKAHAKVKQVLATRKESPVSSAAIHRIDTYVREEKGRIKNGLT